MLTAEQKKALKSGQYMGGGRSRGYAAYNGNNIPWTNGIIPYEIDCSLGMFLFYIFSFPSY